MKKGVQYMLMMEIKCTLGEIGGSYKGIVVHLKTEEIKFEGINSYILCYTRKMIRTDFKKKLMVIKNIIYSKLNLYLFIAVFTIPLISAGKNPLKNIYYDFPVDKSFKEWEKNLNNKNEFVLIKFYESSYKKYKVKNIEKYGKDIDSVIIIISSFENISNFEQIMYFSNIN